MQHTNRHLLRKEEYRQRIQSVSGLSTLEEKVLDLVNAETIEQIEAVLAKYGY